MTTTNENGCDPQQAIARPARGWLASVWFGAAAGLIACGGAHNPTGEPRTDHGAGVTVAPRVPFTALQACEPLIEPDPAKNSSGWRFRAAPQIAADVAARCHSPDFVDAIDKHLWAEEGRGAVMAMGRGAVAGYDESARGGHPRLCPSTEPVPRTAQAPGQSHAPTAQDFDTAAWRCLRFGIERPMYFQVMTTSDGSSFAARASARRSFGAQQIELTIVLHGHVDARGTVTVAPEPVEEWRAL